MAVRRRRTEISHVNTLTEPHTPSRHRRSVEELMGIADPALFALVPERFLHHYEVLPIGRVGRSIVVATTTAMRDVPELAAALGAESVDYAVVTPADYVRLELLLRLGTSRPPDGPAQEVTRDLLARNDHIDARTLELFDTLVLEAIGHRASDIHLERYGSKVRVRLRVDGDLHDVPHVQLTVEQLLGLVNVIKVNASLDITEHRLPQGGRFSKTAGGAQYDMRVQIQPTLHGEYVVIRLLPQNAKLLSIEDLGFPPHLAATYRRLLTSPSGLLLVVGPTGSGKTTTLYAGLQVLARDPTRKVITIEDPIEYQVEGIQQSQVRPEVNFHFADAMRAFVRQDPDVIFVGEIRDGETALEAIRASQTGHLVLSTLHCNDSVDAIQRLVDLGMHPNSISSELAGVFAQRLGKRICDGCSMPDTSDSQLLGEMYPEGAPADFARFRGTGCEQCAQLGTSGRTAVVEFLPASPLLRRAITSLVSLDELRAVAESEGFVPMVEHALSLVSGGVIAFDELGALFLPEQLKRHNVHRQT